MNNPNANIIPRGVKPGHAYVSPFEFAVRTMIDFDMAFLQDRVRSEIFVNGKPCGVYAAIKVDDSRYPVSPEEALRRYGPDLEREADMEGFCTATLERLGELSGQCRETAMYAIDSLVESGRVEIVSRKPGVKEWRRDGSRIMNVGEYRLLGEEWS